MVPVAGTGGAELPFYSDDSPLQARLKEATKEIHERAEKHPFVASFVSDRPALSNRAFCLYLNDTQLVYRALERELLANKKKPAIAPLCIETLFREKAIEGDLEKFPSGRRENSPSAIGYYNRLASIGKESPHLLIAHAYVNYLRDLSGGQIVKKYFDKIWPGRNCTTFLTFREYFLENPTVCFPFQIAAEYRELLNALPLNSGEKKEIVEEAFVAYTFAIEMMDAVAAIPNWNVRDLHLYCKKLIEALDKNEVELESELLLQWREQFPHLSLRKAGNKQLEIFDSGGVKLIEIEALNRDSGKVTTINTAIDAAAKAELNSLLLDLLPLCYNYRS